MDSCEVKITAGHAQRSGDKLTPLRERSSVELAENATREATKVAPLGAGASLPETLSGPSRPARFGVLRMGNPTSLENRFALSISETCQVLGISRAFLYVRIRTGEIKTFRLGGRRLIPTTELQRIAQGGAL